MKKKVENKNSREQIELLAERWVQVCLEQIQHQQNQKAQNEKKEK